MNVLNFILLQAAGGLGGYSQIIMIVLIFVIFYFFMIRPQQKKQKDIKTFADSVQKGDTVVTIGGLHGKIAELDTDTVVIEVDRGTRLKFDRSSIAMEATKRVQKGEAAK